MTFKELVQAARDKRAVTGAFPRNPRPFPAVFILNMPGAIIARQLDYMKVYEKATKKDSTNDA